MYKSKDGVLLKKSAINDRMNALGIKSFPVSGQGSKRFIKAADVLRLNMLDAYIQENGTLNGFPGLIADSAGERDVTTGESAIITGSSLEGLNLLNLDEDEDAGDIRPVPPSGLAIENASLWQVLTRVPAQEAVNHLLIKPLQEAFYPKHKKTEDAIRTFALAAKEEAILTTSQIADLLGVGTSIFSGKQSVTRMGFTFIRAGKEGRETGWRVIKGHLPNEQESSES